MGNARNLGSLLNTSTTIQADDLNIGQLGNRNLIINGAMQVWQRGTSQTTSGGYGADRFWMANATSASRSTDVPAGFTYSTKLTYSASTMAIGQPIELVTTGNSAPMVSGANVTLSFYAKVDSGTEDFTVGINFRDDKFSGTNQASFNAVGGSTLTATTTWQRFVKTFTVPTVNGTNVLAGLEINNIDKDFYLTGVQLEVGDTATPFEHRSYGQELALCQRYFWAQVPKGEAGGGAGNPAQYIMADGGYLSNGQLEMHVQFPVQMRAAPSTSVSDGADYFVAESANGNDLFTTLIGWGQKTQTSLLYLSGGSVSGVAGQYARIAAVNSNAYVYWDAEL